MNDSFRELPLWPAVAAYVLVALLGAVLIRGALRSSLSRARPRIDEKLFVVLLAGLPRAASAAFFLLAVGAGLRWFPLPQKIETLSKHVLPLLFGSLAVAVVMRIAFRAIDAYGELNPSLKSTAGMGKAITWIVGLALIAVVISDSLGISLAPALTALGIGSLAVALALQDTLSNFFSGVHILIDKPIRPGDFIRLAEGQEGYVEAIGWRTTQLRTLAPSTIIVPNATLSKAVITNFKQQNPRLFITTFIEVSIEADPAIVDEHLRAVAATATDIAGVRENPAPSARLAPGFGDRGLVFSIYCSIEAGTDPTAVQHELRKRALLRLRGAGVALAAPAFVSTRAPS